MSTPALKAKPAPARNDEPAENSDFEALLLYLKDERGFDFTGYKRASLERRVEKRMQSANVDTYANYRDYLEANPDEFSILFNTILINVTGFFRDAPAWEFLSTKIVPDIISSKADSNTPIRIWSAGCASGAESYTLAILLAEALGRENARERVKIYATDADEEALDQARYAVYTGREVAGLSTERLEKYFERIGDRYTCAKELRRMVIFGRHDLIQDAPISRVDLLVCRNTLMYFNSEAQARILARFHFALNEGGYLMLGKAETLLTHDNPLAPVDLRQRVFLKTSQHDLRSRMLLFSGHKQRTEESISPSQARIHEAAFDTGPVAQIVVSADGTLSMANRQARSAFGLNSRNIGQPLQKLEVSFRPVELRTHIDRVFQERRPCSVEDIEWTRGKGAARRLDLNFVPLLNEDDEVSSTSITFTDVTGVHKLQNELQQTNQELETTLEELQSTNEELETTNEELQSTVEELETTNEELQSTNEELETMNEELQSTNEELETINDELRQRSLELNHSNAFLEAILTSLRGGVVVVDQEMEVQAWNRQSENLWGLRREEVIGRHFVNLDIGLPVQELMPPLRACLAAQEAHGVKVLQATNRRGRSISCRVTCSPLNLCGEDGETVIRGVILVMEEVGETA